ncbi:ester cyclase [Actinoplanes sp. NPDC051513]|uniref:ester cyclase n=1 Tax=Actinoplanes sp. NPDC051513 TaxID=3363908 RepID=UPI0037A5EC29
MDATATVERMYAAANGRNLDALPEIFAADFYSHPLRQRGVEPIRAAWKTIFETFPELRVTPRRMIAAGDRVAVWSVIENVPGEPELMELIRVADDRIAELWGLSSTNLRP